LTTRTTGRSTVYASGGLSNRAARGSVYRKMACRPLLVLSILRFKAIDARKGQPAGCPFAARRRGVTGYPVASSPGKYRHGRPQSRCYSVPTSPAVPAATENNNYDDQNDEKRSGVHLVLPITTGSLRRSGLSRTTDNRNELAHDRGFGPCENQPKKELLLFFGFRLGDPKKGLRGVFSELLGH
jgi:hypothetical protein